MSAESAYEVAVLGGGAAGLMAAIVAARRGRRVLLLERNPRVGVKILASGGGRCNLTTTREGPALERSFPEAQQRFLRPALSALPPRRLRAWFEEHGVETRDEAFEKVFPTDGRASSVQAALLAAAEAEGVAIVTGYRARELTPRAEGGFTIVGEGGAPIDAARVVVATGGKSYPKTGTTGDGYEILARLGHTITPLWPGLVGLVVDDPALLSLAGIAVEDAAVEFVAKGERIAASARPVLVTHRGLSGPGPMNVAAEVAIRGGGLLRIDWASRLAAADYDAALVERIRKGPERALAHLLPGVLPERLAVLIAERAACAAFRPGRELTREQRLRLVATVKGFPVRVVGTLGFDAAEVTRGGVALDEVDQKTMESRRVPGLYVCGEVLDVDGPIGGFNFQAAFATGWIAGEAVARSGC